MKKKALLSLLLVLILTAGCLSAMAESDDPSATVVVTINGEPILLSDILPVYQQLIAQYQQYGLDTSDQTVTEQVFTSAVNSLMQEKLIRQKSAELGLDQFTEEQEEEWKKTATENYDYLLEMYVSSQSDSELTDEEKREQAADMLKSAGYDVDNAIKNLRDQELLTRVFSYATEGIEIPDAAVETAYNDGIQEAKDRYAEDPAVFGTELLQGGIIYYTPEGYRTVKHILVKCDDAAELKELKGKLADLSEGDAEYQETASRIDEIMATVQPKLDEIQGKIDTGEDFQALIDEYGEDSGMKGGSTAETGYYMCASTSTYVAEFTEGGMALEAVGDISEPILTDYGFHIIRYNSDVASGETPFEDIQEAIKTQLLSEANEAAYTAKIQEWAQAAVIEYPQN